jgi:hypothetical protein
MDLLNTQPPDPIRAEQARQNQSTRGQRGFYESHRASMERLIVPKTRGGKICVLGAGNCNDLDLTWLTEVYREVHLVDLDEEALAEGVARQKVDGAAVHCHSPIDLTGIAAQVAQWESKVPGEPAIVAAIERLLEAPDCRWGECDRVVSPCVLTQTMNPPRNALREAYGPSHPLRAKLRQALLTRHLRTIAASLRPSGKGVVAIDLISNELFEGLPRVGLDELPGLMSKFIGDGRHYLGVEPAAIVAAWRGAEELRRQLKAPEFHRPWLWHLGLRKSFLVYGVTFEKRGVRSGVAVDTNAAGF